MYALVLCTCNVLAMLLVSASVQAPIAEPHHTHFMTVASKQADRYTRAIN